MPRKYEQFPFKDIGLGLDTYSPKDKIQPGALSQALNVNAESNSIISTRTGYERYYGNIPFRVSSFVEVEPNVFHFYYDTKETIDFSQMPKGPLLFKNQDGETVWYPTFSLPFKKIYIDGEVEEIIEEEPALIYAVESVGNDETSHTFVNLEKLAYTDNQDGTYITDIKATPTDANTPDFEGIFFYLSNQTSTNIQVTEVEGTTFTYTEDDAISSNYIVALKETEDSTSTFYMPGYAEVNLATNDVTVTTDTEASLVVVSVADSYTRFFASIPNQATGEPVYLTLTNVSSPFNFVQVWAFAAGEAKKYLLEMHSIEYVASSRTLKIGYVQPADLPEQVQVVLAPAEYEGNIIKVEGANSFDGTDVIYTWGLDHAVCYFPEIKNSGGGYVTHIDNYRGVDGEKVICGLGGNLFEANSSLDVSSNVRGKTSLTASSLLSPLFTSEKPSYPSRTRGETATALGDGQIVSSNMVGDYAKIDSITILSSSVVYKFPLLEYTPFNDHIEAGDILSVTGCRYKSNNGKFTILSAETGGDEETGWWMQITTERLEQKPESSTGAKGNVFTDVIPVGDASEFKVGDSVISAFTENVFTAVKIDNNNIFISGVDTYYALAAGISINYIRTTDLIPIVSTDNFVCGDMVKVDSNTVRIKEIDTDNNTLLIDSDILLSSNGTSASLIGRWEAIPNPVGSFRTEKNRPYQFDELGYTSQPFIKSVNISQSMYFANGADELKKYDGASIYNAGLPPFQGWAFVSTDTDGGALLGGAPTSFTAIDVSFDRKYFVVDSASFATGDRLKVDTTNQLLTVSNVEPFGTSRYRVFVEEDIDSTTKSKVTVNNTEQLSGITPNNFTSPLSYVVSGKGTYQVEVDRLPKDYDVKLLSVKIEDREATIDHSTTPKQVTVHLPYQEKLFNLKLAYEVPSGSVATWQGEAVLSGTTEVEFSPTTTYLINPFNGDAASVNVRVETVGESDEQGIKNLKYNGVSVITLAQYAFPIGDVVYLIKSEFVHGKNKSKYDKKLTFNSFNVTVELNGTQIESGHTYIPGISDVLRVFSLAGDLIDVYEFRVGSTAPSLAAFSDIFINNIPVPFPSSGASQMVLPYNTDLSNCLLEFTYVGDASSKVKIYNSSTSAYEEVTNGSYLDLSELGNYYDSNGQTRLRVESGDGTRYDTILIEISTALQSDAKFLITPPTPLDVYLSGYIGSYSFNRYYHGFTIREPDSLSEIIPILVEDNEIIFKVDPTFNRGSAVSIFYYLGISVFVGEVAQQSDVTQNALGNSVDLVITNENSAVTRLYSLQVEDIQADTKEIVSIRQGKNLATRIQENPLEYKLSVPYGTSLEGLRLDIEFKGEKIQIEEGGEWVDFDSGVTPINFGTGQSGTKNLRVYDSEENYISLSVIVSVASLKIGLPTSIGFSEGYYYLDDQQNPAIKIDVPYLEDITNLIATFNAPGDDGNLIKGAFYRYYTKFSYIDRNDNLISSAMLGSDDMYAEVFDASDVQLKLLTMPAYNELDYSRLEVEVYRAPKDSVGPFYKIYQNAISYADNTGYVTFTDNTPDLSLQDTDVISTNLLGGEIGTQFNIPPYAKVMTSVDNRLVLANFLSPHRAQITVRKKDGVSELSDSDLDGLEFNIASAGFDDVSIKFLKDTTSATFNTSTGIFNSLSVAKGQWVYISHPERGENQDLSYVGWWKLSAENTIPFSIGAGGVDVTVNIAYAQDKIPVYLGEDGNLNQRFFDKLPIESQALAKMSIAINAVMSQATADTSAPWILAQGGQSFSRGNMLVQAVGNPDGEITITPSYTSDAFEVFVDGLLYATEQKATSVRRRYNSRMAVSYRNFAEIFNNPFSVDDLDSTVIDVNPADGQEITAMVPFFGASAFGAAQLSQALVVFKTNSIYLVDVASNQVQKLQTQGQGCTAPKSVAVTKNGIFFANESGVYRLGTDMKVSWVGRGIDGIWRKDLEKANISLLAGHNYAQERRYKLSFPLKGNTVNSDVLVYDSAREEMQQVGSWTRYDNHPALGWCNQIADSFFAGTDGRIYKIRNTGDASDYRDDDQGIPCSFTFGATSYGMPDERKITDSVTIQFQNDVGASSNIKVLTRQSISGIFNPSGTVTIPSGTEDATIRFSLPNRKGTHVETRVEKEAVKDEKLQISALTYGVRTTGSDGVPQARKYRS